MRVLQVFVSGISLLPLLLVCSQHWSSAAASTALQLALFAGACPRIVCFRDVSSAITCWHVSWACLLPSVVVVVILVVLFVVVVDVVVAVVVVVAAFCVVVVAKVLRER